MKTFFQWLAKQPADGDNSKMDTNDKEKHLHQMKTIWEESSKYTIPENPDLTSEWFKVKQAIKIADAEKKGYFVYLNSFRRAPFAYGYAIILVLLIASISFLMIDNPGMHIIETAYGEKLPIILPDGSHVQLNSGSKISYPGNFNKQSRLLYLSGEAYFEVERGKHPFIVQTASTNIVVVGTQFNVNSRNNRVEVAVNKGIVTVSAKNGNGENMVTLEKGQFCICEKDRDLGLPQSIPFKQYPGWLYGKLIFHKATLEHVCQEIERQFKVKISLVDNDLTETSISGLFEANDLDNLISSICLLVQKDYKIKNDEITIFSKDKLLN